jgi:hypothetical protein
MVLGFKAQSQDQCVLNREIRKKESEKWVEGPGHTGRLLKPTQFFAKKLGYEVLSRKVI